MNNEAHLLKSTAMSHFARPGSGEGGVHVRDYIKERALKIGEYIVETNKTVRDIAKEFGISKSTVHKDLTERLPGLSPELSARVEHILHYHKSIRHIRGGAATREKWKAFDHRCDIEPKQLIKAAEANGEYRERL